MENETSGRDYEIEDLVTVLKVFDGLTPDGQRKLINMVATHIGVANVFSVGTSRGDAISSTRPGPTHASPLGSFSEDRAMSAKEFIIQKQPRTEVERVACLGYYLTHYQDQPHFKSLDLSKINTEAAQPKMLNPARTTDHAVKNGLLVPAPVKGYKQLSAAAEKFIEALPDRDAAKAALASFASRRSKRKRPTTTKSNEDE
jgi:hypothetical protein